MMPDMIEECNEGSSDSDSPSKNSLFSQDYIFEKKKKQNKTTSQDYKRQESINEVEKKKEF